MASVTIRRVVKSFGSVSVIKGVDVAIEDGEFVVLVGPSGCGKSTLLRMIAGLEDITSGTISIGATVVNEVAPKERDVAMVFQNYALYPHMTVTPAKIVDAPANHPTRHGAQTRSRRPDAVFAVELPGKPHLAIRVRRRR